MIRSMTPFSSRSLPHVLHFSFFLSSFPSLHPRSMDFSLVCSVLTHFGTGCVKKFGQKRAQERDRWRDASEEKETDGGRSVKMEEE